MLNVLVTGANGFVGRHLVEIAQCDPRIKVYKGLKSPEAKLSAEDRVLGDLSKSIVDPEFLSSIDVIIHLAARVHVMNEKSANPLEAFRQVNLEGTRALLVAAKAAGVKRFIYVSTIKVNGESTTKNAPFTEQSSIKLEDSYAISKF